MSNSPAIDSNYYVAQGQQIAAMGYKNPAQDTDERQRQVWSILTRGGYTLKIVPGYDCSTLGCRESEFYQYFQTRSPGEEDVTDFYEQFYVLGKKRKRIIFGMMVSGEFFVFLGNKRIRAHQMGINAGYDSLCDIVIVDRPGMTDDEKCALAHQLARCGNKQQDTTRDETEIDYQYQLSVAFRLHCKIDPSALQWDEERKVKWGKQWVIDNISHDYEHTSRAARLTRLVNAAFSANGRGASLPMPDDETIKKHWKEYYGKSQVWDTDSTKVTMIKVPSRHDLLVQTLYNKWKDRDEPSKSRKSCYVVARIGNTLDSKITQKETVKLKRTKVIENITKYNTNQNHAFAGYHLVRRVLFAKQMNTGGYEAWEWDEVNDNFIKKVKN